ncbi:MAG: TetR/AcrR family transcriptional regulator [Rhodomicrobium sp.]
MVVSMTTRLNRLDWLDHGLRTLASTGTNALKAEPLARSLKVSRGSFYWHFRDIEQFHIELLARWRQRTTADIIARLELESGPGERLGLLMRLAMSADDRLERNIRAWATENPAASAAVASVDSTRIEYLCRLLKSAGVSDKQASARALFIYWAYVGRIMSASEHRTLAEEESDRLAALLQT